MWFQRLRQNRRAQRAARSLQRVLAPVQLIEEARQNRAGFEVAGRILQECLPEMTAGNPGVHADDAAYADWKANLLDEIQFWYKHISQSKSWYENFIADIKACKPGFIYHDFEYGALLAHFNEREIRALDVGCGPLLTLGLVLSGKDLTITRYDALACVYAKLLEEIGLDPEPLRSITGQAEAVGQTFAPGSFHFAFSRNALDHCYDPVKCILGMFDVVKDQGVVLLRHFENEADYGGYNGLHKWNFSLDGEKPVLWNPKTRLVIAEHLPASASVIGRRYPGVETPQPRTWIDVTIRKL